MTFRLSQDFDSGSLDISRSTIQGDEVYLTPRCSTLPDWQKCDEPSKHWWINFSISGVAQKRPKFFIKDLHKAFQSLTPFHRFFFSEDQIDWHVFDRGDIRDNQYHFYNDKSFKQDTIFIAYGVPYPYSKLTAFIGEISSSPWIAPLPMQNTLTIGHTLGSIKGGYRRSEHQDIPALPIYGFFIGEAHNETKPNIVLTSGNHCGETPGQHTLEGLVRFLISDATEAKSLREMVNTYVFPNSDPEGKVGGYFRSNPQNPQLNHNRYWATPDDFPEIQCIQQAMKAATNSQADIYLDFHSFGIANEKDLSPAPFKVFVREAHKEHPFLSHLLTIDDKISLQSWEGSKGGSRSWAFSDNGLNARFSVTPEVPFLPYGTADVYHRHGQHYAKALNAYFSQAITPPSSEDESCHQLNADYALDL